LEETSKQIEFRSRSLESLEDIQSTNDYSIQNGSNGSKGIKQQNYNKPNYTNLYTSNNNSQTNYNYQVEHSQGIKKGSSFNCPAENMVKTQSHQPSSSKYIDTKSQRVNGNSLVNQRNFDFSNRNISGSGKKLYNFGHNDSSSSDTTLNFDPEGIDMININQSMNESVVMELDKLNQY